LILAGRAIRADREAYAAREEAAAAIACCSVFNPLSLPLCKYRYTPHNDVSVNDGTHILRWSYNII